MRQLSRIPHPSLVITVFGMNGKYIVKLEAGPMEQSYKLAEEAIGSLDDLRRFLDGPFLDECIVHFNAMYRSMLNAQGRFTEGNGPQMA